MKLKIIIAVAFCLITLGAISTPSHAEQAFQKMDDPCTGHETVGRCADKCPNETDTLLGFDKETGAAVCKAAPTGCPYGDSVPLGEQCDRLAPKVDTTPLTNFQGK